MASTWLYIITTNSLKSTFPLWSTSTCNCKHLKLKDRLKSAKHIQMIDQAVKRVNIVHSQYFMKSPHFSHDGVKLITCWVPEIIYEVKTMARKGLFIQSAKCFCGDLFQNECGGESVNGVPAKSPQQIWHFSPAQISTIVLHHQKNVKESFRIHVHKVLPHINSFCTLYKVNSRPQRWSFFENDGIVNSTIGVNVLQLNHCCRWFFNRFQVH